jgi:hypothetical protein
LKESRQSAVGGRHALGGQQFATGAVLLDARPMQRIIGLDVERGMVEAKRTVRKRCQLPLWRANILFIRKKSLFGPQKFPVPLRTEFPRKPLKLLIDWAPKTQSRAGIDKIPC